MDKQAISHFKQQVPTQANSISYLDQINQLITNNHLTLSDLKVANNKEEIQSIYDQLHIKRNVSKNNEVNKNPYLRQIWVKLDLEGQQNQILTFLNQVKQLNRYTFVDYWSDQWADPTKNAPNVILLKTYYYQDSRIQ